MKWKVPEEGWVKINVDAGQVGELGTSLGVVCRDSEGLLLGCGAVKSSAVWETRIAEAKAALEGVKCTIRGRHPKVVIESDCLQVIQALKSPVVGASDFHLVIEDILSLSSRLDSVVWSFVKRSGNMVAHVLTHFQPWDIGHHCWVHDAPENIVHLAFIDLLN